MGARLYTVTAEMVPDKPFAITAWSGSFALRVLYDVLRRRGFSFGGREAKPFIAEPVRVDGEVAITGVYLGSVQKPVPHPSLCWREVAAGEPLSFTYHFAGADIARQFVEAIAEEPVVEEPACKLALATLSAAQRELPGPRPAGGWRCSGSASSPPTSFMFYGRDVLYPSPVRLMISALKNYGAAVGVDAKRAVEGLAKTVEAVGAPRAKRVLVDIGEGRLVPAFTSEVALAIHASEDMPILLAALKAAELLGVGVSRTLGFGRVRVEKPEEQPGRS
ncbi:MAG: CRISPR system precrRNA processing endoribonuclease RAMP protein Cas6 [Thermofilaceae archaeon]